MAEQPRPLVKPGLAPPQPEPVGTRGAFGLDVLAWKWLHLAAICAVCALIGYRGGGEDRFETWQAMVILGAALLVGTAVATKNGRQGISAAAWILLIMGRDQLAGWATGGWTGGLSAAIVGGVVGAALGVPILLFPRHPLFGRDRLG